MKHSRIFLLSIAATALMLSTAFAAGDAARGKTLFNDPKFAGGVRACSQCHPNGKGLEKAGNKKEFHIAGGTQKSLEEAINACIVNASGGKAIDQNSEQMKNIAAYVRSLKGMQAPY